VLSIYEKINPISKMTSLRAGFQVVDCRHVLQAEFLRPSDGVTKSAKVQPNQHGMGLSSTLEPHVNEACRRDSSGIVLKYGPWRLPADVEHPLYSSAIIKDCNFLKEEKNRIIQVT
jgi:hypothetical protein